MNTIFNDKTILTDCDGVLLDWESSFHHWMNEQGYKSKIIDYSEYGIGGRYGIDKEEGFKLVQEFMNSSHIGFLQSLRDAVYYVRKLRYEHGFNFHIISYFPCNEYSKILRKQNIKRIFGDYTFDKFILVESGRSKEPALSVYKDSEILWVEDKLKNAVLGRELGLDAVLLSHGHNKNSKGIPRYDSWKDIYNKIIHGE